jgi:hypothetical protein
MISEPSRRSSHLARILAWGAGGKSSGDGTNQSIKEKSIERTKPKESRVATMLELGGEAAH